MKLLAKISMLHGQFQTVAKKPSLALLYWYGARTKPPEIENPQPFVLYRQEITYPTEGAVFLDLVVAACEREFGKGPVFEKTDPYEKQCWQILKWLRLHGDITTLTVEYLRQ